MAQLAGWQPGPHPPTGSRNFAPCPDGPGLSVAMAAPWLGVNRALPPLLQLTDTLVSLWAGAGISSVHVSPSPLSGRHRGDESLNLGPLHPLTVVRLALLLPLAPSLSCWNWGGLGRGLGLTIKLGGGV